jgi:succinate dehydrogenase/fumarate reductase flavoprotein subunit
MKQLKTDILILGSGGAGLFAAAVLRNKWIRPIRDD